MEQQNDTIFMKPADMQEALISDKVKSLDVAEPEPFLADPAGEPEPEDEISPKSSIRTCQPVAHESKPKPKSNGRVVWLILVFVLVLASFRASLQQMLPSFSSSAASLAPNDKSRADESVEKHQGDYYYAEVSAEVLTEAEDAEGNVQTSQPIHDGPVKLVSVDLTRQVIPVHTVDNVAYFKSAYYGTIKAGMPAQEYKVVFDTGSGHLILPSRYCYSETCRAHQRYSRSASQSAVDMDYDGNVVSPKDPRDQMTVNFGTGEVTGIFIQEVVCMKDDALKDWTAAEKKNISVQSQYHKDLPVGCTSLRILAATAMSDDPFRTFEFDGVMGLGLPGVSQAPAFNFLQVLSQTTPQWGVTQQQLFAVFLAADGNAGSEITFGGHRQEHLEGDDIYWNDVLNPEVGHWIVRIKSIRVDGDDVNFCSGGDCRAVADTGTSLLGVPNDAFSSMYRLMWHPSPLDGQCKGYGPKLHIELDTVTLTLEPEDYAHASGFSAAQAKLNANVPMSWGLPYSGGEEDRFGSTRYDMQCKPMLMSMDHPEPIGPKLFILGEPVLRKYYTIYDTEEKRIGFGRANHDGEVATDKPVVESVDSWFWADDSDYDAH